MLKPPIYKFVSLFLVLICLVFSSFGQSGIVLCIEDNGELALEQPGDFCCDDSDLKLSGNHSVQVKISDNTSCKECVDIELSLGVADSPPQFTLPSLNTELDHIIVLLPFNRGGMIGFLQTATSGRLANPPPSLEQKLAVLKTVRLLI